MDFLWRSIAADADSDVQGRETVQLERRKTHLDGFTRQSVGDVSEYS